MQLQDVGLTQGKGAAGGILLGGVVGLLTGGTGLALAGLLGGTAVKEKRADTLARERLSQVAVSLEPESSAIIAVGQREHGAELTATVTVMGGELFEVLVPPETAGQLDAQADEAYATLLEALAEKPGGQA
jgi:hypothetical protein